MRTQDHRVFRTLHVDYKFGRMSVAAAFSDNPRISALIAQTEMSSCADSVSLRTTSRGGVEPEARFTHSGILSGEEVPLVGQ